MKRFLVIFALICTLLCLTACNNEKQPVDNNNEESNNVVEPTQEPVPESEKTPMTDEELLADFKENVKVVENRQENFDENGELLYYIEKNYLITTSDNEAYNKIISNYPKEDVTGMPEGYEGTLERYYSGEVYYETNELTIGNVHNGIISIESNYASFLGQPHPNFLYGINNYVLSTGEKYDFPEELKDEIYKAAEDKFMQMAEDYEYEGLFGDYYREDNLNLTYMVINPETQKNELIDEQGLRDIANKFLREGCFKFVDSKIEFHIMPEYSLTPYATRDMYNTIVIDNIWDL